MTKHIAILRGDGIGPEIVAETVRVLDKLIAQGLDASYEYAPLGGEATTNTAIPYPEFTQNLCRKADAVLLGAVGSPHTTISTARCVPNAACLPSAKT